MYIYICIRILTAVLLVDAARAVDHAVTDDVTVQTLVLVVVGALEVEFVTRNVLTRIAHAIQSSHCARARKHTFLLSKFP